MPLRAQHIDRGLTRKNEQNEGQGSHLPRVQMEQIPADPEHTDVKCGG